MCWPSAECFAAPVARPERQLHLAEHRGQLVREPRPVALQELPVRQRREEVPVPRVGVQRLQPPAARAGRRPEPGPDVSRTACRPTRTSACCRRTTSTAGASSSSRSSSISEAASRLGGGLRMPPHARSDRIAEAGVPMRDPALLPGRGCAGFRAAACMWGRASAPQGMWGRASALQVCRHLRPGSACSLPPVACRLISAPLTLSQ